MNESAISEIYFYQVVSYFGGGSFCGFAMTVGRSLSIVSVPNRSDCEVFVGNVF